MTKKSVKAEINSFVRGLITEASPLNFPENASLAEENFELLRTGVRQRRLGIDYEDDYQKRALYGGATVVRDALSTYIWKDAGGLNGRDILVLQSGVGLFFFDMTEQALSRDGYMGTINAGVTFTRYKFASVDGFLIVATGSPNLSRITYVESTNTFTIDYYSLKVRDLWGVSYEPTDNDPYYHPGQDAPPEHFYNLYNQSWGIPRRMEGKANQEFYDVTGYYSSYYLKLPSDSESVWTAISMAPGEDPYEFIRTNAWGEMLGASPKAPKGYFIIDALRRGPSRTRAIEDNGLRFPQMYMTSFSAKTDTTPGGAKVVYEFAGRIFYAGFSGEVVGGDIRSPRLSSYVLFSQLVNNPNDLGKCYQEGDPTSREASEIVDTDGGFIRVSGASDILELTSLKSSLIVVASNGTWAITGGSDYGFSATNYKVTHLSDAGCIAPLSVLKANDAVFYWSANGIRSISISQTGDIVDSSVSDSTIHTFYSDISLEEKTNCSGVYDDASKTVHWMYFSQTTLNEQSHIKELILDTTIPAYYSYKITNPPGCSIRSIFPTSTVQFGSLNSNVVLEDGSRVLSGIDTVVVEYKQRLPSKSSIKYLMVNSTYDYTFGHYWNGSFKDWYSEDGVGIDAEAYLLTGAITAGDSSVDKQVPYITVHMYRTENGVDSELNPLNTSSCLLHARWDWSNSPNSNKWGSPQQVYRYKRGYLASSVSDTYDTGFELITTKNKLRGQGKSVSLYFKTEPGKDCRIVGWNINLNGNSVT